MDLDVQRDELADALRRVSSGDTTALKVVYGHTSAKLFGICLRILGEPAEAEDVLQEVYTTVWRKAGSFDARVSSPITWLATLARNRAIDRLRSRRGRATAPVEAAANLADPALSAEARMDHAQGIERLHGCLDQLDEKRRHAVRAAFLDGHTYEALARRAGVPLGTMKSWIRRSLAQLKACLDR